MPSEGFSKPSNCNVVAILGNEHSHSRYWWKFSGKKKESWTVKKTCSLENLAVVTFKSWSRYLIEVRRAKEQNQRSDIHHMQLCFLLLFLYGTKFPKMEANREVNVEEAQVNVCLVFFSLHQWRVCFWRQNHWLRFIKWFHVIRFISPFK